MLTKKVKSRIIFLALTLFLSAIIIFIILKSLEQNVIYFLSPSEIYNKENISFNKKIRVGGLVKINSISKNGESINFIITDLKNEIIVSYIGIVPNLFSEGKGVVAEGKLKDKKYFVADKILAKHDENYMPPEVKEALEKSNN
ncbi:cytochrome c maturation protein CcmE [Pelagibacteraceae bacterium]|jgi:cytochrome c-type biogenesis protein CcmE|nr:cytochrome c maturation protein CcmE [Pelagibacteraceae bacterium]